MLIDFLADYLYPPGTYVRALLELDYPLARALLLSREAQLYGHGEEGFDLGGEG